MRSTNLKKTLMVRRFIDDIIIISENETVSTDIIENLKSTFKKHNLNLTFLAKFSKSNRHTLISSTFKTLIN